MFMSGAVVLKLPGGVAAQGWRQRKSCCCFVLSRLVEPSQAAVPPPAAAAGQMTRLGWPPHEPTGRRGLWRRRRRRTA